MPVPAPRAGEVTDDPVARVHGAPTSGSWVPRTHREATVNADTSERSDGCVFCRIVDRDVPAVVVYEDDRVLAFLDAAPSTDGHTLVVPKSHAPDLLSVGPEDLAAVATASQAVARLLGDRLKPDGFTLLQANGRAGWQEVFHLHVHVVPRWEGDPLRLPWRSEPASRQHLATIAARLGLPPCT